MDEQAIINEKFSFSPEVNPDPSPELEKLEKKDKALANLTEHPDFFAYEQMVQEELVSLRQLKGVDLSGLGDAELGQKVRAAHLAADEVDQLLIRVKEASRGSKRK